MQRLLAAARGGRSAARCAILNRGAITAYATQAQTGQTPQDSIECFVNGVSTQVAKGSTVLQACDAAGIDIPRWVVSSGKLQATMSWLRCSIAAAE